MILIDGHNLLGTLGRDGSNDNIAYLVSFLQKKLPKEKIIVVYDNRVRKDILYEKVSDKFSVYFADPDLDNDADDCIVRIIPKFIGSGKIIVITADRELRLRLRGERGVVFESPEEFLNKVETRNDIEGSAEDKDEAIAKIDKTALEKELLSAFTRNKKDD